jgi:F0F1-type ATP synthase assembly protein I
MTQSSPESTKRRGAVLGQLAMVMELPFVLIMATLLGGGIGYLFDRWLHTTPILLLVIGAVGAALGLRDVIRRLSRYESKARGADGQG